MDLLTRASHRSAVVTALVAGVAMLSLAAALAGLFWPGGDGVRAVPTYRGQVEQVLGEGIYRESSRFAGAGARGCDVVTLVLALPLLLAGTVLHRRGRVRGTLLLAGALAWFSYVYGSNALGAVAYNDLFLVYVGVFGASLWALILLLGGIDPGHVAAYLSNGLPRRGPGIMLLASGVVTAAIWLIEPVAAMLAGSLPPSLGLSTPRRSISPLSFRRRGLPACASCGATRPATPARWRCWCWRPCWRR